MSTDSYLDARKVLKDAIEDLANFGKTLSQVGETLAKRPQDFTSSAHSAGLPKSSIFRAEPIIIDTDNWPSADQLVAAIWKYNVAVENVLNEWQTVPKDRQDSLMNPSDLINDWHRRISGK